MKHAMYTIPFLFCLALGASPGRAGDPPAAAARANVMTDVDGDAPAKVDAETARRDLEQMRVQMRDLSRRMAELSMKLGDVGPRAYAYSYVGDPDRGMIGVVLTKDEHGLRITAVTPGGPADKAGVKNGDVIVAVNGADIADKISGQGKTPAQTLREVKIGQEVKLSVLRDGKKLDIAMKAERREPYNLAGAFGGNLGELGKLDGLGKVGAFEDLDGADLPADVSERIEEQVERASREAERTAERAQMTQERTQHITEHAMERAQHAIQNLSMSMPWWGLNLASLNPDLGAYFGADHGVLVLSADADASKTLKSGDILLAIDGKKIERPEDALRLLREQPAGNTLKVEVLRQRKAQTLSMRAPEFKSIFVPPPPRAPRPPAPPVAAPAPPAPPPPPPPVPPTPSTAPRAAEPANAPEVPSAPPAVGRSIA